MAIATDNISPQERFAQIVLEETDGGRKIVRFFRQVVEGELNHERLPAQTPHSRWQRTASARLRSGLRMARSHRGGLPGHSPSDQSSRPSKGLAARQSGSDHAPEPHPHPTLPLIPTVSEYLSESVEAYEEQSPLRQLLPQDILDIVDSDDPMDECPCAVAEAEGRDISCTENEECPYYGIEFPEFSEEDEERVKEHALRGLRMRAELL